jgi:LPPG:FO 2-phospho-L-lactate transferase
MALTGAYKIVLFVGGVGGAKLAYGLSKLLPPDRLTIVVNVGDDFWHLGLRICPDADTVLYTLAGRVDSANGWGVANDTSQVLTALADIGGETWFRIGDADLATHLTRTDRLRRGARPTEVATELCAVMGVEYALLPVTDESVPTIVDTKEKGRLSFQSYFVANRWQPTVTAIGYEGADGASVTREVGDAIDQADAIIIAPSNPWLSIAPMLAVGDLRARLLARDVPRIAMSPIIGGRAVKGPAAKLMRELGLEVSAASVADYYGDLLNGFVDDVVNPPFEHDGLKIARMDTMMPDGEARIRVAQSLLEWLES